MVTPPGAGGPAAHSSADRPGSKPTVPYIPISPSDPWVGFLRKMFPNVPEGDILQYAGAFKNNMSKMIQTEIQREQDSWKREMDLEKQINPELSGSG